MCRKMQAGIASSALAGSVIIMGAMIYLAFAFPKTVAVWADQGRQLTAVEVFIANLSNMVKSFGFPLLGLLTLLGVASLVWLVVSISGMRNDAANTASVRRYRAGR